ncbi:MAG: radical SAM protein [Candidatus Scalindua sp. AMX11]|nr:MAG: radical SAM protein [Candidatus Scalindua sp.]NOG83728.1 radical SAM protein [Planctomycetota bacterium]RZV73823.1 MAG: radical SAM protein [Candidatus Scalindua sp. SCAELEC01]TDE64829.1 MAG: radical SAM protein [Candidatus Scalindua sp. AMX11]GJQ60845.1 MAG: radical SAM protein [Candidatus Scalindua sp.]
MSLKSDIPEIPTIRPPSEWRSLLVRLTRGCEWDRCRFCGIYPHLGEPGFTKRSVAEIKHDIDLLKQIHPDAETAFFGDADPLLVGIEAFTEVARYVRHVLPIQRLTCYARASTLWKLKGDKIKLLSDAGLNRVHIGLESGDPETLRYHRKGHSPKLVKETAAWLKEAGIEISFYVLLGLGGRDHWRRHIHKTAQLINETEPEFVRIRRLWLYEGDPHFSGPESPLLGEIRNGLFNPQTPEGSVQELKMLIEELNNLSTFLVCDHENNYVHVSGVVKENREQMLATIDEFLALPETKREVHYLAVGSHI